MARINDCVMHKKSYRNGTVLRFHYDEVATTEQGSNEPSTNNVYIVHNKQAGTASTMYSGDVYFKSG